MGVKFIVKQENNEKEINLDTSNTVADLKKKIIEEYQLKCKCLDIYFQLEVPIRGMGKYTLEKGLVQRSMDIYSMDKFNVENKTLLVEFKELEEGYNVKIKDVQSSSGKYVPPSRMRKMHETQPKVKQKMIDINDINEFPPLG